METPVLRPLLLSVAFAAVAGSALAQSQPYEQVEAPKTWRVDVGGGITHGFSATGNTGDDVNYTAWGSASYKDVVYANGLDGVGWNALKTDDLRAGVQIRPRFAAGDIEGSSLDRPGLGADAALYAYKRFGGIVVGGRISQDVSGDDAGTQYFASVGHQRVTPVGLLRVSGYVTGGSDERIQRYYGVTAEQARAAATSPMRPRAACRAPAPSPFWLFRSASVSASAASSTTSSGWGTSRTAPWSATTTSGAPA